jgi:DNA-binding NarL/FixJ family response regulator
MFNQEGTMIEEKIVRVVMTQGSCLLRNALAERLEKEPWIEVCATATDVEETQTLIIQHRPDVLVMNVSPKCSAGVSSLKKLKKEFLGLAILAFSCDSDFEDLCAWQAMRASVTGYISSADTADDLVMAIRAVRAGEQYISPRTKLRLKNTPRREAQLAGLSQREAEVFFLTGCGHVTKRIAEKMDLSVKTVESYRERIRKKMKLLSGADLLHASVSFMRSVARRGLVGSDKVVIRALLSATQ